MINWLVITGLVIILVLAGIAVALHWRLYRVGKARKEDMQRKRTAQRDAINRSIQIIARALEAEQVGATEASIRISVLLDALEVDAGIKEEFTAFYKLAEEASHIPILDAWKALPRERRRAFEEEIVQLEEKYGDFITDAATRIQGREF